MTDRPAKRVLQMRLVVETTDYDEALHFYRDVLGADVELQIHGEAGEKVTILDVGRATLELSNPAQVEMIDRVEVAAELVAPARRTPWDSLNSRLEGPAGLQLTLFQELPVDES